MKLKIRSLAIYTIILVLGLFLLYNYYNSDYRYYYKNKYKSNDNEFVISQTIQRQFLINYKLNNFDVLDLEETLELTGWELPTLELLKENGLYIVQSDSKICVYSNGFNKIRDNIRVNTDKLGIINYLRGVDILVFKEEVSYNICDLLPWEYRWFINGKFEENPIHRAEMNKLERSLLQLKSSSLSRSQLQNVLFHGRQNENNEFYIECVCKRSDVDSTIIEEAIKILQDSSKYLIFDEFYLPATLPKTHLK